MNECHQQPSLTNLKKTLRKNSLEKLSDQLFLRWGWQINFPSTCNWKKARLICSCEKYRFSVKNKLHIISQLRKAIMKRSTFKNKANTGYKPADKKAY